jgi:DNA-binding MarR family transcriptional regulator
MSNETNILDVLTIDEIEILEQMTGKDASDLFGTGKLSAKTSKIMVWLLMRRKDSNADIAEAGKLTIPESSKYIKEFVQNYPKALL